eukprot:1194893-Prorocentrum_minimum.AAC.4
MKTAQVQPEAKAAVWAVRNKWFGTDVEMTETAYGIHDDLMGEGVDPSSDLYYDEIERRIHLEYPDRFPKHQLPGERRKGVDLWGRGSGLEASPTHGG